MTSTISKLSNGIRVVTLNNGAKGAAQVGIFSNTGSGAEATQYVGKMNLLSNAITASNPLVSARTTRQNSAVKTQSTTSGKALNRLASALYDTKIDDELLAKAKEMSLKQVDSLDRDYWTLSKEYAYRTGFQGESLGEPVHGRDDTIHFTTADELKTKANFFAKDGAVIVAVGDVDHATVEKEAAAAFGDIISTSATGSQQGQLFTGSVIQHRADSMQQAWATLMQSAVPASDPDYFSFLVATKIVGSWQNTEEYSQDNVLNLARRFWRNPNWCAKYNCFYDLYQANGVFGITYHMPSDVDGQYAGVRIQNFIASMSKRLSDFHAVRGKNALLTDVAKELEQNPLEYLGRTTLEQNQLCDVKYMKSAVQGVSAKSIGKAVDNWLFDQEIAAGCVGATDQVGGAYQLRTNTGFQWLV